MNRLEVTVLNPGLQTTIQDSGRKAYHSFGVPGAGPMDQVSANLANRLVGNPEANPLLEFTIIGPELQLTGEGLLAITGGDFPCSLNQQPISMNEAVPFQGTNRLKIGRVASGCRGYLAIAGNWELEPWLNSCSTSPQFGSDLTPDSMVVKGKTITIQSSQVLYPDKLPRPAPPGHDGCIRILAGPEYSLFETELVLELLRKDFTITPQSNRMGYRLADPLQNYTEPIEIISSGVVPGTVQLVPSGQLIILMADAQTTGGYPRIANVIGEDLVKLAQMQPGESLNFKLTSLKEVHQLF